MEQLGKYQLIRKLATGGMAEVFLAKSAGAKGFQKRMVVKRILPHLAEDPKFVDMFFAEATLAAELNHPNIVQIFDFGEAGGKYFIAMELIDGPNLRSLGQHARAAGTEVPFELYAKMISHACEGLHFAHELRHPETQAPLHLIHRDISPDNILLSKNGAVKVADFGIARASTPQHVTEPGVIKGKLAYMAPEQLARREMDRRVDVFALGLVFYELLSGSMPFDATTEVSILQAIMSAQPLLPITARRADVPLPLARIIGRATEKDRDLRYSSCKEMQREIEEYLLSTGRSVQPQELAQLVEKLDLAVSLEISGPHPRAVNGALDSAGANGSPAGHSKTFRTPPRSGARPSGDDQDLADTQIRDSSEVTGPSPVPTLAGRRRGFPWAVGAAGLLLAGGGAAYLWVSDDSHASAPSPGIEAVVETPPPAPVDAGAARVATPIAESPPAQIKRTPVVTKTLPARKPPARAEGTLEFRIRPYATVYLDGKELGQTPLPAIEVAAGAHQIRLVNPELGKDLTFSYEVRAGVPNLFKHNLKE